MLSPHIIVCRCTVRSKYGLYLKDKTACLLWERCNLPHKFPVGFTVLSHQGCFCRALTRHRGAWGPCPLLPFNSPVPSTSGVKSKIPKRKLAPWYPRKHSSGDIWERKSPGRQVSIGLCKSIVLKEQILIKNSWGKCVTTRSKGTGRQDNNSACCRKPRERCRESGTLCNSWK